MLRQVLHLELLNSWRHLLGMVFLFHWGRGYHQWVDILLVFLFQLVDILLLFLFQWVDILLLFLFQWVDILLVFLFHWVDILLLFLFQLVDILLLVVRFHSGRGYLQWVDILLVFMFQWVDNLLMFHLGRGSPQNIQKILLVVHSCLELLQVWCPQIGKCQLAGQLRAEKTVSVCLLKLSVLEAHMAVSLLVLQTHSPPVCPGW